MAETLIFSVPTGEPSFLIFLNRTFLSIKRRLLARILRYQNDAVAHSRQIFREVDDSATEKKCELNAGDCLSNDGGNGRHAVFNALDTMLKDSLERLKMMSWSNWKKCCFSWWRLS
ncbi:hypothetical protein glysoja_007371 [Glycine soja]|nr:hypothetical protein glysoja_007371 [Glycine soja]